MPSTRLVWKWEDEDDDGEGVGPVWVDILNGESLRPDRSEEWDRWAPRAEAERYATEHGFEFIADE